MSETKLQQIDISKVKGIGPKKAKALHELGIDNVNNLLTYYPFRYNDFYPKSLFQVHNGEHGVFLGHVTSKVLDRVASSGKCHYERFDFLEKYSHKITSVTVFNQRYLRFYCHKGQPQAIIGQRTRFGITGQLVVKIPKYEKMDKLQGVYHASSKISSNMIRGYIKRVYHTYARDIHDYTPAPVRDMYHIEPLAKAIHDIQFPKNWKEVNRAQYAMKFNELFWLELHLQAVKAHRHHAQGVQIQESRAKLHDFVHSLPFQMTSDQLSCATDIVHDMQNPFRMNRLLQGDVGSGKTIVAAVGVLDAVLQGYQVAIMVPTSILAEQHYRSFTNLFNSNSATKDLNINVSLLLGNMSLADKQKELAKLKSGQTSVIIGTESLIQEDVQYHKLGLVVIDEQQSFGVGQRAALSKKNHMAQANVLAMTATPIPRTLSATVFGDMDISVIRTMPKGRKPIKTYYVNTKHFQAVLAFMQKILSKHQQIYIVTPLVENADSDEVDVRTVYQGIKTCFPSYSIGLLYGEMSDEDKAKEMGAFKSGKYQIMVSTTVVAVGVDVANASLMVIVDADNFGLAQLHQLRGRVGRSSQQSYCLLLANPSTDIGAKRLKVMTQTSDGFKIAKADLELRGGGDPLGQQQSGLSQLKLADPLKDQDILLRAQKAAKQWIIHCESNQKAGV